MTNSSKELQDGLELRGSPVGARLEVEKEVLQVLRLEVEKELLQVLRLEVEKELLQVLRLEVEKEPSAELQGGPSRG